MFRRTKDRPRAAGPPAKKRAVLVVPENYLWLNDRAAVHKFMREIKEVDREIQLQQALEAARHQRRERNMRALRQFANFLAFAALAALVIFGNRVEKWFVALGRVTFAAHAMDPRLLAKENAIKEIYAVTTDDKERLDALDEIAGRPSQGRHAGKSSSNAAPAEAHSQ